MWLGTAKNICRFDGNKVETFPSLKLGYASSLSMLPNGQLVASISTKGLCQINPQTLEIKTLLALDYSDKNLLNDHYENAFVDSHGDIWMSDLYNIKRYRPAKNRLTVFPMVANSIGQQVGRFFEDKQHRLWLIAELGLFLYHPQTEKFICKLGAAASNPTNRKAMRLISANQDRFGHLWIGAADKGLLKYTPENDSYQLYSKGLEQQHVQCAIENIENNGQALVFVGTKSGLSIFNPITGKFWPVDKFQNRGLNFKSFINDTQNGILWICSTEGLIKYRYKNQGISTVKIPKNMVKQPVGIMSIRSIDSTLFALGLSHTGVLFWQSKQNTFKLWPYPFSASTNQLHLFGKNLYAFTDKGIFYSTITKPGFRQVPKYISKSFKTTEFKGGNIDKHGRFWVANLTEGLKVFDLKQQKEIKLWTTKIHDKYFKNSYLKFFLVDNHGQIWLAMCVNALLKYDEKLADFISVKDMAINKGKYFAGLCINSLGLDTDGGILAACWGGISKVNKKGQLIKTIDYEHHPLIDTYHGNIAADNEGNYWVSTTEGLEIIDSANRVNRLSTIDGLKSNFTFGFYKTKDNNLLIGGNNVFTALKINEIHKNQIAAIHLSSMEIDGKRQAVDIKKTISIPPEANTIKFHFSKLNYEPQLTNQFKYQMQGLNTAWAELENGTSLSFTNLPTDKYSLLLRAENQIGKSNKPLLKIDLEVLPYFHQTGWFRSLLSVLAIGLLYGIIKWRLNNLRLRNQLTLQMTELKLRALQSQMNPHFLFNSLNSIQNYILTNKGLEAAKYISKFSKLVRKIMENSSHQFLNFEEIIDTLKMYVEIESFRFNHEFSYQFDIENNDQLLEAQLPPMLLQPFVENAIWHGLMPKNGTKHLIIKAFIMNNSIHCIIEDNGVGRDKAKPTREGHISRGEEMTKGIFDSMRHKNSQARMDITDLTDGQGRPCGTRVEMQIPL